VLRKSYSDDANRAVLRPNRAGAGGCRQRCQERRNRMALRQRSSGACVALKALHTLMLARSDTRGYSRCVTSPSIRPLESADYDLIEPVVDEWWGGRPVRGLLQRLFFEHFGPMSFFVGADGAVEAFLIGFRSQSQPRLGYIHFVGVRPDLRGRGLGRLVSPNHAGAGQARVVFRLQLSNEFALAP
jgi:ribosomal protein S18 acetylase RimI-like enzyme